MTRWWQSPLRTSRRLAIVSLSLKRHPTKRQNPRPKSYPSATIAMSEMSAASDEPGRAAGVAQPAADHPERRRPAVSQNLLPSPPNHLLTARRKRGRVKLVGLPEGRNRGDAEAGDADADAVGRAVMVGRVATEAAAGQVVTAETAAQVAAVVLHLRAVLS
jgi:hypothetical protein